MLDKVVVGNTISFLMRTDIKGHEAFAMVECVNRLRAEVEAPVNVEDNFSEETENGSG